MMRPTLSHIYVLLAVKSESYYTRFGLHTHSRRKICYVKFNTLKSAIRP